MEGRRGLRYEDIPRHTYDLLDLTSLTVDEFEILAVPFEEQFLLHMKTYNLDGSLRSSLSKPFKIYRTCPLPTAHDRLLFILSYLKSGAIQIFHAYLFGMRQSYANQWIHLLLTVLHATLQRTGDTPSRTMAALEQRLQIQGNSPTAAPSPDVSKPGESPLANDGLTQGVLALSSPGEEDPKQRVDATAPADPVEANPAQGGGVTTPAEVFSHDATERPIARPVRGQKVFYSGKKKRHSVKNNLLVNAALCILFLSATVPGSVHDKRIADETPYPLPENSELLQDLGFQGFNLDNVRIVQPQKKPRGQDLSEAQKASNREISQRRIRIEHVNSSVKRCRILSHTCTSFSDDALDTLMDICCGLHNFRIRISNTWTPMA